jgi:uncharacterized protein YuzE
MIIKYFQDTDTLLINFNDNKIVETKDINENTYLDFDNSGNIVSITLEHAKNQANLLDFSYQQVITA